MDTTESTPKRKAGRPKGSTAQSAGRARPTTEKARIKEYERLLPQATLNDFEQIKTLVSIELELERLRTRMGTTVAGKLPDALEIRKLSEAVANLSKEYRLNLVSLGIERNLRGGEIDMQGEVDDLVKASTELVEKVGRRITCIHCVSDYDMGLVLFHFEKEVPWRFQFICPACGEPNQMTGIAEMPEAQLATPA